MKMNGGGDASYTVTASAFSIGADATATKAAASQPPPMPVDGGGAPAAAAPSSTAAAHAPLVDELELIRARSASLTRPPLVICGPSGVGKGTLIGRLVADHPRHFGFSVSHTTRGPRPGEVDGVSYHFTTREAMEPMVERGLFLEHAEVHGNLYGTSAAAVLDVCSGGGGGGGRIGNGHAANGNGNNNTNTAAYEEEGRVCVLDIDVQGAAQLKRSPLGGKALFVFVAPPSLEELERRLRGRGTETEDRIARRLAGARAELAKAEEPGFFDEVVVNDDLDHAYAALLRAVEARAPPGTLPPTAVADAEAKAAAAARLEQEEAARASAAAVAAAAVASAAAAAAATAATGQKQQQRQEQQQQRPGGGGVRSYLEGAKVDAALREALLALASERPAEPLRFIAEHLFKQHEARAAK